MNKKQCLGSCTLKLISSFLLNVNLCLSVCDIVTVSSHWEITSTSLYISSVWPWVQLFLQDERKPYCQTDYYCHLFGTSSVLIHKVVGNWWPCNISLSVSVIYIETCFVLWHSSRGQRDKFEISGKEQVMLCRRLHHDHLYFQCNLVNIALPDFDLPLSGAILIVKTRKFLLV